MKHLISIIILALLLNSCKVQQVNNQFTPEGKTPYLLGKIDKTGLESEGYSKWFTPNFNNYSPDAELVSAIKPLLKDYKITVFMGTWCGDSKREVPRLYKILEATDFPTKKLTTVALSKEKETYKESPQHEEEGLNIVRVPTIIFFKDDKEVNRIIESPKESLEKDILNIITKNTYKSNYFGAKRKPKKAN